MTDTQEKIHAAFSAAADANRRMARVFADVTDRFVLSQHQPVEIYETIGGPLIPMCLWRGHKDRPVSWPCDDAAKAQARLDEREANG